MTCDALEPGTGIKTSQGNGKNFEDDSRPILKDMASREDSLAKGEERRETADALKGDGWHG